MTNQIPAGTKNLSVNVPIDEWSAHKEAASTMGMKLGEYLRWLVVVALSVEDPATAGKVKAARNTYYGNNAALRMIFLIIVPAIYAIINSPQIRASVLLGLFLGLFVLLPNDADLRRTASQVRPQRTIRRDIAA